MNGVNKAILVGHLGRDPEVRRSQDGKPVVSLSVATSESWKDKGTGERKQRTDWHRVVIFAEGLAKVAEQYLKKGSKVYLEGAIKTRKYQDKDGTEKWTTEIVLNGFHSTLCLLDRAERPAPDEGDYGSGDQRPAVEPSTRRDDMDDEIPF